VLAAPAETVRAPAQGDLEHLGRGHGADPGAVLAELAGISDVSQRMAASSARRSPPRSSRHSRGRHLTATLRARRTGGYGHSQLN
jgi:hypothetical protein